MARKYLKGPSRPKKNKPAQSINNAQNTNQQNQQTMAENKSSEETSKPIEEQHKEFVKAAEESVKQNSANEPVLDTSFKKQAETQHPFETPTIERAYTDSGIKSGATQNAAQQAESIGGQSNTVNSSTQEFEPSPPPPEDDPNYADTHQPNDTSGDLNSMNIPRGSAEELVKWGAKTLNYLIGNFGSLIINIKIKPEYHSIRDHETTAAKIIKEFNESNAEKLKLDDEDIAMLTPPIVRLLQEKGIKGLTAGEELMLAVAMVAAKKVKVIVEIRGEGKRLEKRFDSMIQYMSGFKQQEPASKETETPQEQEPITVVAEEV